MPIKNIIFDLGGVILNIDFKLTEQAFRKLGVPDFSVHITQHHITPLFEEYETGKVTDKDFIQSLRGLAGDHLEEKAVIDAWNALLLDFPPERIEYLKQLKPHYRIFLLSNTNHLHQLEFEPRFRQASGGIAIGELFEKTYYSHQLKLRKPGEAIYRRVIEESGLVPAESLFIDDTAVNLSGAKAAGLQTIHLQSPATILDLGLLQ